MFSSLLVTIFFFLSSFHPFSVKYIILIYRSKHTIIKIEFWLPGSYTPYGYSRKSVPTHFINQQILL